MRRGWYNRALDSLTRETTSTTFIPEIDGLRFLAIVPVVVMHMYTHLKRSSSVLASTNEWVDIILNRGGVGVILFFAISGFILSKPFAEHYIRGGRKPILKKYYLRRVTRLEPPYIISLLLFYVGLTLFQQVSWSEYADNLTAGLFYLHYSIYGVWNPINPVSWSLETEVQFYVLAPLLAYCYRIAKQWGRISVLATILIVWTYIFERNVEIIREYHLFKSLLNYLPYFLVGLIFADISTGYDLRNQPKSRWWDLVGFLAVAGIFFFASDRSFEYRIILSTCLLMLFCAAFRGPWLNYIITRKTITVIGGMCYTIYLLHYPIIGVMVPLSLKILPDMGATMEIAVTITLTLITVLGLSVIFFRYFEKPFMRGDWYKNIFKKNDRPTNG